jgi:hypothetical protein
MPTGLFLKTLGCFGIATALVTAALKRDWVSMDGISVPRAPMTELIKSVFIFSIRSSRNKFAPWKAGINHGVLKKRIVAILIAVSRSTDALMSDLTIR